MTKITQPILSIESLFWTDPRAVLQRQYLSEEMIKRYADREAISGHLPPGFFVDPRTVIFVALCLMDTEPVGHIAVRRLDDEFEIKNMFVAISARGQGVAEQLLNAAERASLGHGAHRLILQTGDRQPEAVKFYQKMGFRKIPLFEPYCSMSYSNCFEKPLSQ